MDEGERIFSEKEAANVIQHAARLQEERDGEGTYAPGLTRDELLRFAAEAGIAPENVEAAIRAARAAPLRRSFLNLVEETERVVDAELDPSDFDVILDVAKPVRTRHDPVSQVGRTLTMRTRYKSGLYNVEVAAKKGRTRIRVSSNPFLAYFMCLHPAIILALGGGGYLGGHGMYSGAALFVLTTLMVGALAFMSLVRRSNGKTAELADRLEAKVRETMPRAFEELHYTVPPVSVRPSPNEITL